LRHIQVFGYNSAPKGDYPLSPAPLPPKQCCSLSNIMPRVSSFRNINIEQGGRGLKKYKEELLRSYKLSALMSTKCVVMSQQVLSKIVDEVFYWTDSEIVLAYIKNESKSFRVYFGNRVEEIRDKSEVFQWKHCPSKDNPADDVSRGLKPAQLTTDCRWFVGPAFLSRPVHEWPPMVLKDLQEDDPETIPLQAHALTTEDEPQLCQLLKRCSSFDSLKRKIVWLTRFSNHLKNHHHIPCACTNVNPT